MLTFRDKTREISGIPCRLPRLTTVQEVLPLCIECAVKADNEGECAVLQKPGSRVGVSRGVDGDAVSEGERLKTCHVVTIGWYLLGTSAVQAYSEASLIVILG